MTEELPAFADDVENVPEIVEDQQLSELVTQMTVVVAASPVVPATRKAEAEAAVREKIVRYTQSVLAAAKAAVVASPEQLAEGYRRLKLLRADRDEWKGLWSPHIEAAMERKRVAEADRKKVVADFDLRDKPLSDAEVIWSTKIGDYEEAETKRQEDDRKRLQAVADAEAVQKTLDEALALEDEMLTAPSRDEAQQIESEMEQLLEAPIAAAVVTFEPVKPKGTGVTIPQKWSAEITDLVQLLSALTGNKLDRVLTKELTERIKDAVMVPLNARAVALKSALSIPGVRATSNRTKPRIR